MNTQHIDIMEKPIRLRWEEAGQFGGMTRESMEFTDEWTHQDIADYIEYVRLGRTSNISFGVYTARLSIDYPNVCNCCYSKYLQEHKPNKPENVFG